MRMALPHVNPVGGNVCSQDEQAVLVPADIQSLALPYRIELGPFMDTHDLSVRVFFPAGLADMLLSAAIGFRLKGNVVMQRGGKQGQVLVRQAVQPVRVIDVAGRRGRAFIF